MGQLKGDLAGAGAQLIETHTAWVFLEDATAIKVKKPVNFGFLDFTTLEKRRAACEAELALNSRLAPDVYQQVVPIARGKDGIHRVGDDGEIVDYAVKMKRLPDACRADVMLSRGELGGRQIEQIAITLARFHACMETNPDIARYGTPEVLSEHLAENFEQTRQSIHEHLSERDVQEILARQQGFVVAERDRFIRRALTGRVRDGHGDLRLEHVYFEAGGTPTIIDCIEFNDRFRYGDVCSDIAFLSMDLARLGRVDLAERLLAVYAREANDFDLYALVDFYEGYRAFVRAKVASMLEADSGAPIEVRKRAKNSARRHYLLALSSSRGSLLAPVVVAVGGIIATGKSTVAQRLSELLSAPVVSSDRTRKHLLGLQPESTTLEPSWQGAYAPSFTMRVYAELLRRAACVASSGRSVILDASFRSGEFRRWAELLASSYQVPFYFVECRADLEICRERLERRSTGSSVSDARAALLDDFAARWEPVREVDEARHVVLDTTRPVEENLALLAQRLPAWPSGLTA